MVGAIGNLSASSTTPLSVRASAAADILAQAAEPAAQPSTQISDIISSGTEDKLPLYNSIQFIYKQDYGRVVLLEQQPDTGQEITQIPSQYRLQQYQATIRAQRRSQLQKLLGGDEGQFVKRGGTQGAGAAGATGAKPSGTTAPAPAPQTAPAPQAAPQVSAPAAAVAHVDIRV
jgi:TolA-binding protein